MSKPPRIPAALSLDGLTSDARSSFTLAAAAGYSGIAIPTNHAELSPDALGESARRHLRKTLDTQQLGIAAIRAVAPRAGLTDPTTIDRTVSNIRKALKLASELTVPTVTLYAGPVAAAKDSSAIVSALKQLAQEADTLGLTLAVTADSDDKLLPILAEVSFGNANLNLSPASSLAAGEDPLALLQTLRNPPAALTATDLIKAGRHLRPVNLGEGQVPYADLLALLREHHFTGPTIIDLRDLPNPATSAQAAADFLRRLMVLPT